MSDECMYGNERKKRDYRTKEIFTCYFFSCYDHDGLSSMRCCLGSVRCCLFPIEWHFHWFHARCCWPSLGMRHRNDLSDCHQPNGNSANASNMFSPCTIPTYHGIYIPDAFHFEHAINKRKRIMHILINQIQWYILLHDEIAKNWHYSCINDAKQTELTFRSYLFSMGIRVVFTKSIHI